LRGSSNKKTLYSPRSCVNWGFFGMSGPTSAKKVQFTQELVKEITIICPEMGATECEN
jgi:hypothetical protein